jgi:uncharacterized Ntn-hydrolase superfamily protein
VSARRGLARRRITAALAAALLASTAAPTWSVVAVDTRTGEIAVAGATCLANLDLQKALAVVYNDVGVAAAQSSIDIGAVNRQLIWDGFQQGLAPDEILQLLALADPQHQSRQYGIVDLTHDPVTFTGSGCGLAALGRSGTVGDLRYAVQGNVLTGDLVIDAAERALLETEGDLSQRVLAAMESARRLGGDGRCSCGIGTPTLCGVPPPGFTKSAHVAFFVVSRKGGRLGECSSALGCANGTYFLDLKYSGGVLKPDPVLALERLYAHWRRARAGQPDQVASRVTLHSDHLPPDGSSAARVEVELNDIEGEPVGPDPQALWLAFLGTSTPVSAPSAIVHLGGNRYGFSLKAGTTAGSDRWQVWTEDERGPVLLLPEITLQVGP